MLRLTLLCAQANTSQFFFSLARDGLPQLNGKHVVFGKIVSGEDILDLLEEQGTKDEGVPKTACIIADCGLAAPPSAPELEPELEPEPEPELEPEPEPEGAPVG